MWSRSALLMLYAAVSYRQGVGARGPPGLEGGAAGGLGLGSWVSSIPLSLGIGPLPSWRRSADGFVCKIDDEGRTCGEVDMRGVSPKLVSLAIKFSALKPGRCANYGFCSYRGKEMVDCGPLLGSRQTRIYNKGRSCIPASPIKPVGEGRLTRLIRAALRLRNNVALSPIPGSREKTPTGPVDERHQRVAISSFVPRR